MARNPEEKPVQGTNFRRVTTSFNASGGSRREPPKITVLRTGACRSNTAAKEMAQAFVRDGGGDRENFHFTFGGNEEKGQLALYLPQPGDLGLMKVSVYSNSIGFHAGAAFIEHPDLRPVTTVECSVERKMDAEGVECLVVQVKGGTPVHTVKRKKKKKAGTDSDTPDGGESKQ